MITIKMQPNSKVTYSSIFEEDDNCILVDNYPGNNRINHMPAKYNYVKKYADNYSVGVWRVKQQINNN